MKLKDNPYFIISLVFGLGGLFLSGLAAVLWADGDFYMGFGYHMGDRIWMMGLPLTGWLFLFNSVLPPLSEADDLWAVPLATVCMTVQWILWGCLILWAGKKLCGTRNETGDNPTKDCTLSTEGAPSVEK